MQERKLQINPVVSVKSDKQLQDSKLTSWMDYLDWETFTQVKYYRDMD